MALYHESKMQGVEEVNTAEIKLEAGRDNGIHFLSMRQNEQTIAGILTKENITELISDLTELLKQDN